MLVVPYRGPARARLPAAARRQPGRGDPGRLGSDTMGKPAHASPDRSTRTAARARSSAGHGAQGCSGPGVATAPYLLARSSARLEAVAVISRVPSADSAAGAYPSRRSTASTSPRRDGETSTVGASGAQPQPGRSAISGDLGGDGGVVAAYVG